jgi:hypothetical protein
VDRLHDCFQSCGYPAAEFHQVEGYGGMVYVGRDAREGSAGASVGVGRGGLGRHAGGVLGEMVAGQIGRGLVRCIGGGVIGRPLVALVFGKNLSCSAVIWQKYWRAGAKICAYKPVSTLLVGNKN